LDENEFDVLMKPQLIPKHKINRKPPRSKASKQFKRKDIDKNRNKVFNSIVPPKNRDSQRSRKRFADQDRMGSIMTDHTRFGEQKIAKDRYYQFITVL
jgi:hypothetical protein